MKRRHRSSLGRRLSWWLAWQSFGVLVVVCLAVYAATALSLAERQQDTLAQKQQQVLHLLNETARNHDLTTLKHKLDDYFVGHQDMTLVLRQRDGSTLYESTVVNGAGRDRLEARFDAPPAMPSAPGATAMLTLDTRDDALLLRRLATTLMSAAIAGALIVSAGGFLLVRLGLKPLHHLVEQTRRLAADTLRQPLDGSAQPEELQPLIAQFNALLGRLAQSYEQLEGFNADVAHELCTPLATLVSSTELAMRRRRTADDLRDVLGSNLEELHRIAGIVQDMLFLSQADRGSVARRAPTPSLAALVGTVAEYHEAALEEAGLRLDIVGDASGDFDVQLLRRALSNLVGNATQYAQRATSVRIDIDTPQAGEVRIAVSNRGLTIDSKDLPRLFDRFFRSEHSRSDAAQHHGLGLSIVAAIARMHGGRPFATSADGLTTIGMFLDRSAIGSVAQD